MSTEDGWTDDRWIERKGQRKAGEEGGKKNKESRAGQNKEGKRKREGRQAGRHLDRQKKRLKSIC